MVIHPSDSSEQLDAEPLFEAKLSEMTGLTYDSERITVEGTYVEVDAVGRDANGNIVELAEIYARQDRLDGGQEKKPTDDAARLLMARAIKYPSARLRLVYSPVVVAQIQRSWRGSYLRQTGIELTAIELDEHTVDKIRQAQKRQSHS